MSIALVRGYARTRMKALGYQDWDDSFNENIPSTKKDISFFVELGRCSGVKNTMDNLEVRCDFEVRIYKSPTRGAKSVVDAAVDAADLAISAMVKIGNRLAYPSVTLGKLVDVVFNSMVVEQASGSNDNGVVVRLNFTALVIKSSL